MYPEVYLLMNKFLLFFFFPALLVGQELVPTAVPIGKNESLNQKRAFQNNEPFLQLTKYGKEKVRYYLQDPIAIETIDSITFVGTLVQLNDSTLFVSYTDIVAGELDVRTIPLEEVLLVYRQAPKMRFKFNSLGIIPSYLLFDWMAFNIPPQQNLSQIPVAAAFTGILLVVENRKLLFGNRARLNTEKWDLRVRKIFYAP